MQNKNFIFDKDEPMTIFDWIAGGFLFVLLGFTILLFSTAFTHEMKCTWNPKGTFIEAVGHKSYTTYLYKLEDGRYWEAGRLPNADGTFCAIQEWGKK